MVLKANFQKQSSKQSFPKVISNQMIKYLLPHTLFNQINGHKYGIYLYGKLTTKLLVLAANKNINFLFTRTGRFVSEMALRKNSKQALP